MDDKWLIWTVSDWKLIRYRTSLSLPSFLTAFVPVNFPTLTTQVLNFICSLFYPISSCYLTIFLHFCVGFTLFIVLLYFIISQRFSFYTSATFLWHAVSHSHNVIVSFSVFCLCTTYCSLLLVISKLHVIRG